MEVRLVNRMGPPWGSQVAISLFWACLWVRGLILACFVGLESAKNVQETSM